MDVSFSEGERAIFEKMVSVGVLDLSNPTSSIWYALPTVHVAEAQSDIHQMFSDLLAEVPYDKQGGTVPERVFERLDLFHKNMSLPFFMEANDEVAENISDLLISGIGAYPRYLGSVLYKSQEEYWYQALRISLRTAKACGLVDPNMRELDDRLSVNSFREWVSSNDTHELKSERNMFSLITQRDYQSDLETHFSKLDRSRQFYRQIVSFLSPPNGVSDAISIVEMLRFFENLARLAHLPNIIHPFGYALELQGALDWSWNRSI